MGKSLTLYLKKKSYGQSKHCKELMCFLKTDVNTMPMTFYQTFLCVEVVPITNLAEVKTKAPCFGTQKRPEMRENASVKEDTSSHKCL